MISSKIRKPLSTLFNNMFIAGYYPDEWKLGSIAPGYKPNGPKFLKNVIDPFLYYPHCQKSVNQ